MKKVILACVTSSLLVAQSGFALEPWHDHYITNSKKEKAAKQKAMLISVPPGAGQLPGKPASASEAQRTHHATGVIESIDPRNRRLTVAHDPVPSLRWPSMTMDFALKDGWSAVGLQPGDRLSFQLTPSGADYIIVSLEKAGPTSSGDSSPRARGRNGMQSHGGHGMHSGGHGMHGMHSMGMMCDEMMGGKSVWRDMMEGMLGRR